MLCGKCREQLAFAGKDTPVQIDLFKWLCWKCFQESLPTILSDHVTTDTKGR